MSPTVVKRKICVVGEEGVGKSSLIRRFVTGQFDDLYIRTLGAVAWKKTVVLEEATGGSLQVDLMILDIIGKRTFMQMFRDAYFHGAAGVLAVFDLTRRRSLDDLVPWVDGVRGSVGAIPVVVLGNKADLADRIEVSDADIPAVLGPGHATLRTSAKTGEKVEEAFLHLAHEVLQ